MKKIIFLVFILFISLNIIDAQTRNFGLGIMLGDPSGLNGKYYLNSINAIEVGLGVGVFGIENSFAMHVDYLYHNYDLIKATEKFPVFYGFGVRIRSKEDAEFGLGVRGVVGIQWVSQSMNMDIFLHVAPVFKLLPATKFGVDGSIGARYYF